MAPRSANEFAWASAAIAVQLDGGHVASARIDANGTPLLVPLRQVAAGLDKDGAYIDGLAALGFGTQFAGDLGTSITYKMPVSTLVAERMNVTLPLSLLAILISTALALPLGGAGHQQATQ